MNYQQAYTTRRTGLGKLIVNRIRSGQSGVGSVGSAISDNMKAYGIGLMEAFDPLNLAKKLTFGSNLAPVILGKMTGRSEQDMRYFSREKRKSSDGRNVNSSNTYADYIAQPMLNGSVMIKLLTFMKKVNDYKNREMETAKSFHEEDMMERFQRHKEVVEIFLEAINKHRTGQNEVNTKSKKKKKSLMDLPIGKIVLGAGAIAAIALPKIASAKIGEPGTKETPTATLPEAPESGPFDTATKVPNLGTVPGMEPDVLKGIRGYEGGRGDYGASFGMVRGKKAKGKESIKLPEEFGSKKKRLNEMTLGEVRAYQDYRLKKDGASAVGAYQFTKETLFGNNKQAGLVQKLKMDDNTVFDKTTQDKLANQLRKDNASMLEKAGIPITPGSEYAAWYIGAGGAIKVYRAVQSGKANENVADILHPNDPTSRAKLLANNPELGVKKGGDFFGLMQSRVDIGLQRMENVPKVAGDTLNAQSTQNASMKNLLKKPDMSRSIMFSQNTNLIQQRTLMVAPAPEYQPAPIP